MQTGRTASSLGSVVVNSEIDAAGENSVRHSVRDSNAATSAATSNNKPIDFSKIDADYDIGHFEEAQWALEDLLKVYPDNGDVQYHMGLIQEGMLDFDAARVSYEQAVKNMAAPASAYSHLGNLLYKMNQYPQAIAAFEEVVKLKPNDAYTSYMLGLIYMNTGKYNASVQAFKRAIENDASYKQKAVYGQGISFIRMGQHAKGKALLQQSIAIDPKSEVAGLAKKSLSDTVKQENVSYLTYFGLYGYQYDSNVVLKPSTSPNVPLITGNSDFEHTILATINYAPPPHGSLGYKLSARAYEQAHDRLRKFDLTDLGFTVTPYKSLNDKNLLFMDVAFDYILFNYNRYMDTISLKPTLTHTYNSQLKVMASVHVSRMNFYQPVTNLATNQDGWMLTEDVKLFRFTKDHRSSAQVGVHYTTSQTRGTDWSYRGYGAEAGVNMAIPHMSRLTAGMHISLDNNKYQHLDSNYNKKRRDTILNGTASLSYKFTYFTLGMTGGYTHELSNVDVYRYVRRVAGFNFSGSF